MRCGTVTKINVHHLWAMNVKPIWVWWLSLDQGTGRAQTAWPTIFSSICAACWVKPCASRLKVEKMALQCECLLKNSNKVPPLSPFSFIHHALTRMLCLSKLAIWCRVLVLVGTKNTLLNTVLKVPKSIFPLWGWHFNLLSGFTRWMGTPGERNEISWVTPTHCRVLVKMEKVNQIYCFNFRGKCLFLIVLMPVWPLNYAG